MKQNPIVYAIVITYNRLNFLKKCLQSIEKQSYPIKKIIVVDNCSTDGTREYLKNLYNKKQNLYQIIFNKENLGMANGINLALMTIMAEDWDYVWITDDDNYVEKNALNYLIKYSNEETITNSLLLDISNKNKFTFYLTDIVTKRFFSEINQIKDLEFINFVIPFNFTLISKKIIKNFGFLDENYFIRGEEIDYFLNIIKNNINLKTVSKSLTYCFNKRKIVELKLPFLNINRELVDYKKNYYIVRNTLKIIKKFKGEKNQKMKNFFPYLNYNFYLFFFFYFFYNIIIFIFVYKKSFFKYMKSLILAYFDFLVGKKGKSNLIN